MKPDEVTRPEKYEEEILKIIQARYKKFELTPFIIHRTLKVYQSMLRKDMIRNKKKKPNEHFNFNLTPAVSHYYLQTNKQKTNILLIFKQVLSHGEVIIPHRQRQTK